MLYTDCTEVTAPTVGIRVMDPYRKDRRSGIVRAVLGDPRYVQVLCDDDIVRTMGTRTLVTFVTTTNK